MTDTPDSYGTENCGSTETRIWRTSRRSRPRIVWRITASPCPTTLTEEKLKDNFESGYKEKIEAAVQDALD